MTISVFKTPDKHGHEHGHAHARVTLENSKHLPAFSIQACLHLCNSLTTNMVTNTAMSHPTYL